jgi:hypothetical protein
MGLENKVEVSLALWKGKNELEGRSGDETVWTWTRNKMAGGWRKRGIFLWLLTVLTLWFQHIKNWILSHVSTEALATWILSLMQPIVSGGNGPIGQHCEHISACSCSKELARFSLSSHTSGSSVVLLAFWIRRTVTVLFKPYLASKLSCLWHLRLFVGFAMFLVEPTVLIRSFFDQIMDKTWIKQRSCEHIDWHR